MGTAEGSEGASRRVPCLAPDCDATSLSLSAEEGFLLSRIDGHTSWELLLQIGGMKPAEVERCLEDWLERGVVTLAPDDRAKPAPPRGARSKASTAHDEAGGAIDETLIRDDLDIDAGAQRRILEFESRLDADYHVLLGVERDAEPKQIKRAYFKLSKEFHPDRYFRRDIADYGARLNRIFKRVLEAYEILSDPKLRDGAGGATAAASDTAALGGSKGDGSAAPRPMSKLERLRARMPFKIPHSILEERRHKAGELFRAAQQSQRMGRLSEAISSVRIAISFDPYNAEYKSALVDLKTQSAALQAEEILAQPAGLMSVDELTKALRAVEDVLIYRPHDPELNHRAAALALELDDVERAIDRARLAVDHSPSVAAHHSLLGRAHRAKGNSGHARQAFESALEIDPNDAVARAGLAKMKVGRR